MDSKHIRGLMEAYVDVYAPQEEIDEAVKGASAHTMDMRRAAREDGDKLLPAKEGEKYADFKKAQVAYIKRRMKEELEQIDEAITSEKGKAKAAEMIAKRSTASGRAKPGQGASVSQIRHIIRANVDGYGGTPPNLKVAKNPVKSNFTGLNSGTGNKAARREAALKKEELDIFDIVLEFLQTEGYAETLEEAEWMMANVIDEEIVDMIYEKVILTKTPYGMHRTVVTPTGTKSTIGGRDVTPRRAERDPKAGPDSSKSKEKPGKSSYGRVKEAFNIFINAMISEGMNFNSYSWDDLYEMFDNIFEAQVANRDPDNYERRARASETRGQRVERQVRSRLATMDPEKAEKMKAQMRAVGLNV